MSTEKNLTGITAPRDTRRQIEGLVQRFARNLDVYTRPDYKETQVRVEFIDPLFEALGWDVRNVKGYAELYKDVVHEDAIKVSGATKAPDYCFRVGGVRKFFLEAKRPSTPVKGDVGPAYQLRRYAWSAKLPLSILTDFEEFAVYDCRLVPKAADKASVARILYVTFDEYLDRLDEVYSVFARDAVLKGSFDRYVQETKRKRGNFHGVSAHRLHDTAPAAGGLSRRVEQLLGSGSASLTTHESSVVTATRQREDGVTMKETQVFQARSGDSPRYGHRGDYHEREDAYLVG